MAAMLPIVNVASVPQRSPFRYPGGKSWFIPYLRRWLLSRTSRTELFIEPFAGGASSALAVAFEDLAERVLFNEIDPEVAAVWDVIICRGEGLSLAQQIVDFKMSEINVRRCLDKSPQSQLALAFQTILRNRVQRGGIMAPGAGLMKRGENGKGLNSRWYPATLAKRINAIHELRGRMIFQCQDAMKVVREHSANESAAFFVDPPYKVAGSRLYAFNDVDHQSLFEELKESAGDVLLTYDDCQEVRNLAASVGFETALVAMKNTHHAEMTELVVGRKLDWYRITEPQFEIEYGLQIAFGS